MLSNQNENTSSPPSSQMQNIIPNVNLTNSVPFNFEPEDILKVFARKMALEAKEYTTLEEDRELELLNNPETFMYANRMTFLEFNENRDLFEEMELDLLEHDDTRKYANRIMELQIKERSRLENLELKYLCNPILRPYTYEVMGLLNKIQLSEQDYRALFLYLNSHTFKKTTEILNLESHLNELSYEEMQLLSKDYLMKLAQVSPLSNFDFQKINYRSIAYNPANDCVKRDFFFQTYGPEIAKYRAIEDAFNAAAKKLAESYFKQARRSVTAKQTSMINASFLEQNIMNNPAVKEVLAQRQMAIAVVLQRLFFDTEVDFTQDRLDGITNYLNDLIMNQKLVLNTSKIQDLDDIIKSKLNEMKLPEKPDISQIKRSPHGCWSMPA